MVDYSALTLEQRIAEEEQQRLETYRRNWQYYNGDHAKPLAVRTGQPDDNVIINLARLIVDKGASFLFGKEVEFELQEGETTPEEEALEQIWQRNYKMTFLNDVAVTGGVTGQVFIKIVPGEDTPRLVNVQPEHMTVRFDSDDISDAFLFRIEYPAIDREGRGVFKRQDIARQDSGAWQIQHFVARGSNSWKPDPDRDDVSWPWPWPPIVYCQNILCPGSFYGYSDLEDLSEQDAINYLASKLQRILRYHAHPKTVGKNFAPADIKIAEDDTIVLPSADSDLWNLEMQSDLGGAREFLNLLINWYLAGARIPRIDPAVINVGALSGFALRILYGDLLEKTEVKRRTYGDMLVELNRRLLDISGHGDEHFVTVHWPSPLPEDAAANTERDKFELDWELASKETVRTRRGLDNEAEQERIQAEKAASGNIGAMLLTQFTQGQQTGFGQGE